VHRTERSNFHIDSHQFAELTLALFFSKWLFWCKVNSKYEMNEIKQLR